MNAVIGRNNVIAYTTAAAGTIEIAGAVAMDGSPVNRATYRVSASRRNRAQICNEMPSAIKHQHNGRVFYTLAGE